MKRLGHVTWCHTTRHAVIGKDSDVKKIWIPTGSWPLLSCIHCCTAIVHQSRPVKTLVIDKIFTLLSQPIDCLELMYSMYFDLRFSLFLQIALETILTAI